MKLKPEFNTIFYMLNVHRAQLNLVSPSLPKRVANSLTCIYKNEMIDLRYFPRDQIVLDFNCRIMINIGEFFKKLFVVF